MQKKQIFELMNKYPGFHLATVDDQFPRVRGMLLYRADERGIIFHTGIMKDVYRQILKNNNAELCFFDFEKNIQLRVRGTLEIIDDNDLKDEISNHPSREFLQGWKNSCTPAEFYNSFIVFSMNDAKAIIWSMETNIEPKEEISLF